MKISAILAVGKDYEIGLNNDLPWVCTGDIQHFRSITAGHIVLMGFNTYKTIGRPLPNRINIVISFEPKQIKDCICFQKVEDGIEYAKNQGEKELFIIGGASIYKYCQQNNLLDRIYLSHIIY